jgi:hypothetical protein
MYKSVVDGINIHLEEGKSWEKWEKSKTDSI